jgi:hypothetical protein
MIRRKQTLGEPGAAPPQVSQSLQRKVPAGTPLIQHAVEPVTHHDFETMKHFFSTQNNKSLIITPSHSSIGQPTAISPDLNLPQACVVHRNARKYRSHRFASAEAKKNH